MRRFLVSLYPKAWRDRYGNEFHALLDDVPPTWRICFDIFGGAMKMQLKSWSAWKTVAAFGLAGMLIAIGFLIATPGRYRASARLTIPEGGVDGVNAGALRVMDRSSLTRILNQEDLYPYERKRMPIEDLLEVMKKDIVLQTEGSAYLVSFVSPDARKAQRVTQILADRLVETKAGSLLDRADLPTQSFGPRRSKVLVMGSLFGILAGVLFAVFSGLNAWKLAMAFGAAGAILFGVISLLLPETYISSAVVKYEASDAAPAAIKINRLSEVVRSNTVLDAMVAKFGLYPNNAHARDRVREGLRIEQIQKAKAAKIMFAYHDRYIAQKVTQDVVSRLIDANVVSETRVTVELLDPASLPLNPHFPNVEGITLTGFFVGLACAIVLGMRRGHVTMTA